MENLTGGSWSELISNLVQDIQDVIVTCNGLALTIVKLKVTTFNTFGSFVVFPSCQL